SPTSSGRARVDRCRARCRRPKGDRGVGTQRQEPHDDRMLSVPRPMGQEPPMSENVRPSTPIARVVLASFIGTSIAWYHFFLYGTAAALVFNRLFFPTLDPLAGTMASLATYAVGFFARPLGGIVFGHYGDRLGRRSMLVTTLMMMGLSTFLIGVLPTYDQIGVPGPVP